MDPANLARAVAAASAIALPPLWPGALATVVTVAGVSYVSGTGAPVAICLDKLEARGADPARCVCVNAHSGWILSACLEAGRRQIVVQVPDAPGAPLVYVGTPAELAPPPAVAADVLARAGFAPPGPVVHETCAP